MNRKLTFVWLALGVGFKLQVVASLSIAEIMVLVGAPFIFFRNWRQMRHDGVAPFFMLSLLVILGCLVGSIANHTPREYVLRGLAVTVTTSCSIVFSHWILSKDPGGFKWYILGLPISAVLSIFVFRSSVEVTMLGNTVEDIMRGPIFWIARVKPFVMMPVQGWYLHMPIWISAIVPLAFAGFSMLITTSGRSAAISAIAFSALVIIGGRRRQTISRISRHLGVFCLFGVMLVFLMYFMYKVSASQGWLGEAAQAKFEMQTEGGSGGIGRLILGGRGDSFIGLLACRDKPIVGWGPWPNDLNNYTEEFLERFGTQEDIVSLTNDYERRLQMKTSGRYGLSCHAYITEFWAWYGIFGLIFILYAIFVQIRYLKQYVSAVPQWYGWVACVIPGTFWAIFFSPYADRVGFPLLITACLMARAVRRGRVRLPFDMIREIEKAESR